MNSSGVLPPAINHLHLKGTELFSFLISTNVIVFYHSMVSHSVMDSLGLSSRSSRSFKCCPLGGPPVVDVEDVPVGEHAAYM